MNKAEKLDTASRILSVIKMPRIMSISVMKQQVRFKRQMVIGTITILKLNGCRTTKSSLLTEDPTSGWAIR